MLAWLVDGERVYVHCRAGWQRSATVVAAVIALREHATPPDALRILRERKPTANPLAHQRADLQVVAGARGLTAVPSDPRRTVKRWSWKPRSVSPSRRSTSATGGCTSSS